MPCSFILIFDSSFLLSILHSYKSLLIIYTWSSVSIHMFILQWAVSITSTSSFLYSFLYLFFRNFKVLHYFIHWLISVISSLTLQYKLFAHSSIARVWNTYANILPISVLLDWTLFFSLSLLCNHRFSFKQNFSQQLFLVLNRTFHNFHM